MSKLNEDIIIRYLENRCSEEDFVLINEWMKESDENAGELFRMEEIYQLGKFPFEEENLVAKAERRLGRRLEQENQKRQEVFKLKSVLRYAAAIVGVIVLAAGLAYWFRNKAEELVVASAAHGQVREMLLPDGTKVWLNQSSVLKYPRAFEGKERHVYLDGEAYFEVAKDEGKPFHVLANGVDIKVLGTSFNVMAYRGHTITTLVEGKVCLTYKDESVLIVPDRQAEVIAETGKILMREVYARNFTLWKDGVFYFENAALETIAERLSQWYDVNIIFNDEALKKLRYSVEMKRYNNIQDLLTKIEKTQKVKFLIQGKSIYIHKWL